MLNFDDRDLYAVAMGARFTSTIFFAIFPIVTFTKITFDVLVAIIPVIFTLNSIALSIPLLSITIH